MALKLQMNRWKNSLRLNILQKLVFDCGICVNSKQIIIPTLSAIINVAIVNTQTLELQHFLKLEHPIFSSKKLIYGIWVLQKKKCLSSCWRQKYFDLHSNRKLEFNHIRNDLKTETSLNKTTVNFNNIQKNTSNIAMKPTKSHIRWERVRVT